MINTLLIIFRLNKDIKQSKSVLSIQDKFPQYNIGKYTYGNPQILSWGKGSVLEI